ncbi:hypothetical protein C0Q70_20728 [Pomacea canaliculata]|uniref:Methionine aminopeptidase n=2 Tax=Pomacea canaliculata TaxID=400727 RepID=A0A2T7NGG5_POMCA|nr:methionine aminopeptidase 1D, mitochondrial-like isoform X2 [Pomacea canaliculata]PVD20232.1 hypothetical protein C0Q70_20728 [Pomacea canaliculata]
MTRLSVSLQVIQLQLCTINIVKTFKRYLGISSFLWGLQRKHNIVLPGKVSPTLEVPDSIFKPQYVTQKLSVTKAPPDAEVKSPKQIEGMRKTCSIAASLLKFAGSLIKVGMTTDELDKAVHAECLSKGAYPSPLLYQGYPKSICTSVNNVVCHGIPDDRRLLDGDIICVDITVFYDGYHGDTSATFLVGSVAGEMCHLVEVARQCRDAGIAVCRPKARFSEIGWAVSNCAESAGYSVVPEFCGHGIGEYFHGPPDIIHVAYDDDAEMEEGMTFTIEPIICMGSPEIRILQDGWTAVTTDNSWSAQFEHTVLVTRSGVEVLTT